MQDKYWNEEDKKDQEERQRVNATRSYFDDSLCDYCGAALEGAAFQCTVCNSLVCTSCVSDEGNCPTCNV